MAKRVSASPLIEVELTNEVAENYEIETLPVPKGLPETFEDGRKITWLINVNVRKKPEKAKIENAQFVLILDPSKEYVYFKGGVKRLTSGTSLPVGDPPIGII
jgi:hypothetical protein